LFKSPRDTKGEVIEAHFLIIIIIITKVTIIIIIITIKTNDE
jgi:hypothetical protein